MVLDLGAETVVDNDALKEVVENNKTVDVKEILLLRVEVDDAFDAELRVDMVLDGAIINAVDVEVKLLFRMVVEDIARVDVWTVGEAAVGRLTELLLPLTLSEMLLVVLIEVVVFENIGDPIEELTVRVELVAVIVLYVENWPMLELEVRLLNTNTVDELEDVVVVDVLLNMNSVGTELELLLVAVEPTVLELEIEGTTNW